MKKYLYVILPLLLITISFSACRNDEYSPPSECITPLELIMESPGDRPQLSKEDFIEITNNYLSTKEWNLPFEKACFHTYGVNYSAYIIDNEYLFSLNAQINPDGCVEYDFYLSHYIDGVRAEIESDPLLFERFIK